MDGIRTFTGLAVAALIPLLFALQASGNRTEPPREESPSVAAQPLTPRPASVVQPARPTTSERSGAATADADQTSLVKQYCVVCHNDRMKPGGLTLARFDAAVLDDHAPVVEKMIRKLRAGMMPPPGARRPEPAKLASLAETLERRMDEAASAAPNPGWRPSQRLSRAEYARAVADLLGLDVEMEAFLPADTISNGFDNIADSQLTSPTLLQGYLRAASQISRMAVGDLNAAPSSKTWKVPRTASQMRHIDGAPFGTRGGLAVIHVFVADGEYVFKTMLHMDPTGDLYGAPQRGEQLEISLDGARAALLDVDPLMTEEGGGVTITSPAIHITAGPHRIAAAFVSRFDGPVDDLIRPAEQTLADTNIGSAFGVTVLPHIREFTVTGPMRVTGISDTVSRRAIFTCRPVTAADELPCAAAIVERLALKAYRGPLAAAEVKELMAFYARGRRSGGFENGIRLVVQALLASPRFLLRVEPARSSAARHAYRLSDLQLASRLSFFLWASTPDDELLKAAAAGALATPAVYEKHVRRMLQNPRSRALASRFAAQWLRLQDVEKVRPDSYFFPQWDTTLSEAMVRETELLVESVVREDRNILDLLTADYTFVNERLAKHYRVPNVVGSEFRRVQLAGDQRRGILGHGSILTLTSIADRTSPVLRGKWIMEVLLGSPPPPPPPNVPALEETAASVGSRMLSVRERMEEHRKNPACASCHRVIDPLGLALENFDATGAWRINDQSKPVNPVGDLYDGTTIDGPIALRAALLKYQDVIVQTFTENLMTYALGRRIEPFDMPAVRSIVRDAKHQDLRFSTFVLGVVRSAAFRTSNPGAATTDSSSGPGAR